MRDLRALPKAELHVHLEGAIRIDTVRELADRNGVPVPSGLDADGWRFHGPDDFIDQYVALCGLFTELDDFHRLGLEVTEDLAANGVEYAEAVFTPAAHAAAFDDHWTSPLEALLGGLATGAMEHGTIVRVTPDVVRDLGVDAATRTLEVARKFVGGGVVGLNCAGQRTQPDRAVRSDVPGGEGCRPTVGAPRRGMGRTGERLGDARALPARPHRPRRALDRGPARLVERLAADGIPLEVSPIWNVATGVYPTLAEHPFLRLRDAGVTVTLNSDDPPMFGAWLTDVYEAARTAWGLTDEELAAIAPRQCAPRSPTTT